jgi:hypothetical protein
MKSGGPKSTSKNGYIEALVGAVSGEIGVVRGRSTGIVPIHLTPKNIYRHLRL